VGGNAGSLVNRSREHPNIIRLVSDASKVQRSVFFWGKARVKIEGEYILIVILLIGIFS
jgi:hypothetical protein